MFNGYKGLTPDGCFVNKYGYIRLTFIDSHNTIILENIKTKENLYISTKGFISIAKETLKNLGYKIEKIKC